MVALVLTAAEAEEEEMIRKLDVTEPHQGAEEVEEKVEEERERRDKSSSPNI